MNSDFDNSRELHSVANSVFLYYPLSYENDSLLYFCRYVTPIIQNGPECGLVALSMASQLLISPPIQPDKLHQKAREMNFTIQGEMFSAENMASLAELTCQCRARVIRNLKCHPEEIITHVLLGHLVLIPYDSDRNHVPCNNNGRSAHWAIITGVSLAVPTQFASNFPNPMIMEGPVLVPFIHKASKIFVFARQGKSKRLTIWELEELLESNRNLKELAPKHVTSKMILPQGTDKLSGLRDKAVLLSAASNELKQDIIMNNDGEPYNEV